jgi:MFS family permease
MLTLQAVVMVTSMVSVIFVQPFMVEYGVPVRDFGLLTAQLRVFSILGSLMAYRLVARAGEQRVTYALAIGCVVAMLVLGLLPSVVAIVMFALLGFCNATFDPVARDFINRHSPQHMRATLGSVAQMASGALLMIAAPLTGAVADRTSLQTMFFLSGIVLAVLIAVSLAAWTTAVRREQHAGVSPQPEPVGSNR